MDSTWIKLGRPWPSLNELLSIHWRVRQEWKDYFRVRGRTETQVRMIRIPEPLDCYVANIKFLRIGPRELDYDNLVGGCKALIDGIKATKIRIFGKKPMRPDGYPERIWGLFADDNKKHLDSSFDQLTTPNTEDHGSYIKIAWREIGNGKHTRKTTAPK